MDPRLVPLNGLIALLRGDGGWPRPLGDQGFERHQLEVPVSTPEGEIRADALIYRVEPDLILLDECKSGRNIDEEQARKYLAANWEWLRRTGAVPPRLRSRPDTPVATLFVGAEEHRAALEADLRRLNVSAPLLTIGANRVRLSDASGLSGLDDFDLRHDGGLPPARVPVDHQSPDEELQEVVLPQIIAAQARGEDILGIEVVCEAILPEWDILSHSGRSDFIRKVERIVASLDTGEMRGQFRFEGGLPNVRGRIVFQTTPVAKDPRGRTQAWQAQERRAARVLRRAPAQQIPGQLSLDDLADEGGIAAD